MWELPVGNLARFSQFSKCSLCSSLLVVDVLPWDFAEFLGQCHRNLSNWESRRVICYHLGTNKKKTQNNNCGCCQTFLGKCSFFQGLRSVSALIGCLNSLLSRFHFPGKRKNLGNSCAFCRLCSIGEILGSLSAQPGQLGDHATLQSYSSNKWNKWCSLPCWSPASPWVGYSRINRPRFVIILRRTKGKRNLSDVMTPIPLYSSYIHSWVTLKRKHGRWADIIQWNEGWDYGWYPDKCFAIM